MEQLLKTVLLEYDKSSFIIDLIEYRNGQAYIAIEQTIYKSGGVNPSQKIKINPNILDDIIKTLIELKKDLPTKVKETYISNEREKEIVKRYLIGVEPKNLAIQFDCSEEIIVQILTNNDIELVSNKIPTKRYYKRNKRH